MKCNCTFGFREKTPRTFCASTKTTTNPCAWVPCLADPDNRKTKTSWSRVQSLWILLTLFEFHEERDVSDNLIVLTTSHLNLDRLLQFCSCSCCSPRTTTIFAYLSDPIECTVAERKRVWFRRNLGPRRFLPWQAVSLPTGERKRFQFPCIHSGNQMRCKFWRGSALTLLSSRTNKRACRDVLLKARSLKKLCGLAERYENPVYHFQVTSTTSVWPMVGSALLPAWMYGHEELSTPGRTAQPLGLEVSSWSED